MYSITKKIRFYSGKENKISVKMQIIIDNLPELRYLQTLPKAQAKKYLEKASKKLTRCFYEIALNLVYSGKNRNGLALNPSHKRKLKKFKRPLMKLIKTKSHPIRKKLLKGGLAIQLLSVMSAVIASLASIL